MPLIKAALQHRGAAFIDVISPCVAFNNHPGSTKSFDYVREHNEAVNRLDFMVAARGDHARIRSGHDRRGHAARRLGHPAAQAREGLRRHDRIAAMTYLQERQAAGEVVTGLLYLNSDPDDLHDYISTVEKPLNALGDEELCPGAGPLEKYNAANR